MPAQPIAATVRTSCSGSNRASGRGKDSSSRMRTGSQQVSREFESSDCLIAPHRGEVVEKLAQAVPGSQVIEEVLHGDPGPAKHGCAPEDLGVAMHDGIQCPHGLHRTPNPVGND